ncbi:MAG: phosphoglycerate kinase [Aestuariivita sp.]|nr:phosphoglycerate kinase [Aestuariivita sp.]
MTDQNPIAKKSRTVWNTLDNFNLTGKQILTRVDLNVPFKNNEVSDTTRIKRIIPTVNEIQRAGGQAILLSHFGRPNGKFVSELSLRSLVPSLETLLSQQIVYVADCRGPAVKAALKSIKNDAILLLENVRFYKGEESNSSTFASEIAEIADIFCNDAFSCSHRAHASTTAIVELLPSCIGRLMEEELCALNASLTSPKRPLIAIVGGAKVSTKINLLLNLINLCDYLVIGGGMANTFLAAQGISVGQSIIQNNLLKTASLILEKAEGTGCQIILPSDISVATELSEHAKTTIFSAQNCPDSGMILDLGPNTISQITTTLQVAQTLIWNGPLGAFEVNQFATATTAIAHEIAKLTRANKLLSIAGGGDTIAALRAANVINRFSYISTAGGAFLEWMEGKPLPGLHALKKHSQSQNKDIN